MTKKATTVPENLTASTQAPTSAKRPTTAKKAAPVKAATPVKAAQPPVPGKAKGKKVPAAPAVKDKKFKVVRDSFTIPKNEFTQLSDMKKRALSLGLEIKKSELIRAGLLLLGAATDTAFKKALTAVPTLKTGRPGKD